MISPRTSGIVRLAVLLALGTLLPRPSAGADESGESVVWQAVRNTRKDNNFHLAATITGPRSTMAAEADVHGLDFQLNTHDEVLRYVNGTYYVTHDLGQTWTKTKPAPLIIATLLVPIASPRPDEPPFDFLGTSVLDGETLHHFRLHVAPGDATEPDHLPQFWLVQDEKQKWFVRRAKCPVMIGDNTVPMVELTVTRIDQIKPIQVPPLAK